MKKIYARIGFSDIVVPIEDQNKKITQVPDTFLVGYEDEDGNECDEEGNKLE